jgi:hypothetical protein
VHLSFLFFSGFQSLAEDGVLIDHIQVTGDQISFPNLTYGTPSGWSGPIVPSSVQGTHTVNTLYTNQPTYIDFAVRNTQSGTTATFFTDLYVDAAWIGWYYTNGLDSNEWSLEQDVSYTVSTPGQHTLRIEIDPFDWVAEVDNLDNIFIDTFTWTNPVNQPNLTYTTPSGWSGPKVPSDELGTHFVSQLYANQPTCVDWAIKNNGTANAGSFFVRLLVDGGSVQSWYVPGLAVGSTKVEEDFQYTLAVGNHTLRLEIDYYNDVAESNESDNDNIYSQTFYWNPAEITAEGEVWFQQLFGMPYTYWHWAVGCRVELWDADNPGTGQLLDTGHTDGEGHFTLGPVSNVEEGGSRQDIYVRVYAENEAAVVGDTIQLYYPYAVIPFYMTSDTALNVLSGVFRWMFPDYASIDADTVESGFFYDADVIRESYDNWLSFRQADDPGKTKVYLHTGYGTLYVDTLDMIIVEPIKNPGILGTPDVFDKDVITHEFGHRLQDTLSFLDTTEGVPVVLPV